MSTNNDEAPRGGRKVVLADFKARKRDEGAVLIEAEDGKIYRIDPPALWPDEAIAMVTRGDLVEAVESIMGKREFAAFKKAGGSAVLVSTILEDELGATLGKS